MSGGAHERPGKSSNWHTPGYIFDALGTKFDLDVAAPVSRRHTWVPARRFITSDSLQKKWVGFVWMNPPFGGVNGLVPWLRKFVDHGNGVALTPDRTSAPWWRDASYEADAVMFISPKVKFYRPDGSRGESPGNGTTLFAIGRSGVAALRRADGILGRAWFA